MAYMTLITECYACGDIISCNPDLVPSIRDEHGVRQPLCRACVERLNDIRERKGLPRQTPHPEAYSPQETL